MDLELRKKIALEEAQKHRTKGKVVHVTMPNEAAFIDLDEAQLAQLEDHVADKKLSLHKFTFDELEEETKTAKIAKK